MMDSCVARKVPQLQPTLDIWTTAVLQKGIATDTHSDFLRFFFWQKSDFLRFFEADSDFLRFFEADSDFLRFFEIFLAASTTVAL